MTVGFFAAALAACRLEFVADPLTVEMVASTGVAIGTFGIAELEVDTVDDVGGSAVG